MKRPIRVVLIWLVCAAAALSTARALTFSDISAGLDPVHHGTSAWVDYDNDGDLDVFLNGQTTNFSYITRLYRNDSGTFVLVTGTGLPDLGGNTGISRSAWGDFDGDGFADVVMTGASNPPSALGTALYRNNSGDGTFTQVTVTTPGLLGIFWGTTAWGDYDNDGDLDILVTGSGGSGSRIATVFRNDGPASAPPSPPAWDFTDIDPLNTINPTFNYFTKVMGSSGTWGDYDGDSDLDLVIIGYTDIGASSRTMVYRNDGSGQLVDANVAGLMDLANGDAAWGDYNGDGALDLALIGYQSVAGIPSSQYLRVYRNEQNGSFTQVFDHYPGLNAGSAAWGDGNNDGHLDLLVTGSTTTGGTPATRLFYGNGSGGFTVDSSSGLDNLYEGQASWGDYDNDGKLDVLLSGRGSASNSTTTKIFKSNTPNANTAPTRPSWLPYQVTASSIQVKWTAGGDAETDTDTLVYNLSIRDNVAGSTLDMPPMADATTGYRRVVQLGNTNHQTEWSIGGLQPTTSYRVCVQTIDQGFMASDFRCQTITTADPGEEPEIIVRECGPTPDYTSPIDDDGTEPSPSNCGTKYWESPDIWIRNANDGQTLPQSPIFGQDNYIYVRLKNISTNRTLPTGTVHVYFAKPSTSQPWPLSWVRNYNSAGVVQGAFVGQVQVESIAPAATFDAVIKWAADQIPDPDEFTGEYPDHFCLLARFTAPSDPMSFPETNATGDNVMNNNNIAVHNIYIFKPGSPKTAPIRFGNGLNVDALTSLKFETSKVDGSGDHALKHVKLKVTLPPELYNRWAENGGQGSGISTKEAGENSFFVTDPQAVLEGILLNPGEEFILGVEVMYPESDPTAKGAFPIHMIQQEGDRVIGGETLMIHMTDEEK